jgi:hypothetical protein
VKAFLLALALAALPTFVRADDITIRVTLDKKSLTVTAVHGVDADTVAMSAVLANDDYARISTILLGPTCSIQHIFIWRRPAPGAYALEVTVYDRNGKPVQRGYTQLFVS